MPIEGLDHRNHDDILGNVFHLARYYALMRGWPTKTHKRSIKAIEWLTFARLLTLSVSIITLGMVACAQENIDMAKLSSARATLERGAETKIDVCPKGTAEFYFMGEREAFIIGFFADEGDSLSVSLTGSYLIDTVLELYGPGDDAESKEETLIETDDDGGAGGLSLLKDVTIREYGLHWLVLTSWDGQAIGRATVSVALNGKPPCKADPEEDYCYIGCLDKGVGKDTCKKACGSEKKEDEEREEYCYQGCLQASAQSDPCTKICSNSDKEEPVQATCESGCDDGIPCTDDTCIEGKKCTHTPQDERCNDGDPCTLDVCESDLGCFSKPTDSLCPEEKKP
jgi:hypothetical protein